MSTENSISYKALELIYNKGPMSCRDISQEMTAKYKSVYTKLLELEKSNLVSRDDQGIWSLEEGVTPQTFLTGEKEMTTQQLLEAEQEAREQAGEEEPTPGAEQRPRRPNTQGSPGAAATGKTSGMALDQRGMFIKHMSDIGVSPKEAIPTIADIFFAGEIDSLDWLKNVLQRHAQGYVTPHQRNLILGYWAKTRGLPYSEDEQDWVLPEKGGKGAAKGKAEAKEEKPSKPMDPGMGWKVGRDKDGAWIAQPGGPMIYQDAIEAAERRALIDSYKSGPDGDEGEAAGEGEEVPTTRRGKGKGQTFVETMMLKMMDKLFDGAGGQNAAADARVEALEREIGMMREEKNEERFERMEGMIANLASRDPWDDFTRFQQQAQRFGYAPNVVTDSSPAVQLIKDQSDKLDRNVSRMLGMVERMALRSDEFSPEQTRTPDQRESKAGELLNVAQGRERSKSLRRETFGF